MSSDTLEVADGAGQRGEHAARVETVDGVHRQTGAVGRVVLDGAAVPAATATRQNWIGRISTPQPRCSFRRAAGCFDATLIASFRSRASIRK